jgi:hypothetical protein
LNFGKPEKIALELLRSGDEWRIADVERDSGTLRDFTGVRPLTTARLFLD